MAETVEFLYYARVAQNAKPSAPTDRKHDGALDTFLLDHVNDLRGKAKTGASSPASFYDDEGKKLFESVQSGTKKEFLESAHALTLRLIDEMTGATKDGLLVCLQLHNGAVRTAAVLKLQIETEHAAILKALDGGDAELSAVKNVMDAPGKLQKGALLDDPRPESDVIMGDVQVQDALYFPRAFGIALEQKPKQAAVDTLTAIGDLQGQEVAAAAREHLSSVASGPVVEVMKALGEKVPQLAAPEVQTAVLKRVAEQSRPVRQVNTQAPLTEVVSASGVQIKSPLQPESRVSWTTDKDHGGWIITIRVDEEPTRKVQ